MKQIWLTVVCAFLLGTKCIGVKAVANSEEALPPADEVLQKVIARAKWAKAQNFQQFYSFTKSTLTEELDDKGNVKAKQEKSLRVPAKTELPVTPQAGGSNPSFTPGGPVSGEPDKMLKQLQTTENKSPGKKRWLDIDEDTLRRFDFKPEKRELLNGRPTLVFAFEPKRDLPIRQLQDRLLNKATGTVWVDEDEYEVVKADIRLKEPVTFIGGLAGAVQTFRYIFERTRVDEGVWLLVHTDMLIKARQVVNLIYTKKQQYWSDFRKRMRAS